MDSTRLHRGRWQLLFCAMSLAVLLLPLIAMRITDEVNWSSFDFAIGACLLFAGGCGLEVAGSARLSKRSRIILNGATVLVATLVWAHGAVGVF